MRSRVCKLLPFVMLFPFIVGLGRCPPHYRRAICDPNSAYANGMLDGRLGKPFNTHYGANCPVRTWVLINTYRRGYDRGVLLNPLYDHSIPPLSPVVRPITYVQPRPTAPPMRPGQQPVYLNHTAPTAAPPTYRRAVVLNPYSSAVTRQRRVDTAALSPARDYVVKPKPPAPQQKTWRTVAMTPATGVNRAKPVVLNPPPTPAKRPPRLVCHGFLNKEPI